MECGGPKSDRIDRSLSPPLLTRCGEMGSSVQSLRSLPTEAPTILALSSFLLHLSPSSVPLESISAPHTLVICQRARKGLLLGIWGDRRSPGHSTKHTTRHDGHLRQALDGSIKFSP